MQLEDLWLIEAIHNILLEDNLEPVLRLAVGSASHPELVDERRRVDLGSDLESGAGAVLSGISLEGWLELKDLWGVGRDRIHGILEDRERESDEEMREGIEILGSVISGVRYLTPREPIPRSEYLLTYHVC